MNHIIVSSIVAAAENSAIGKENDLPWKLPNDTKFYKYTTWGMPVIMGRTSFDALGNKPLPGRYNIILTKQSGIRAVNGEKIWTAGTPEEALSIAGTMDCKEIFIAGGAHVYAIYMDRVDRIYLTRVHGNPEADTFFPEPDWKQFSLVHSRRFEADPQHTYAYTFETWERKH